MVPPDDDIPITEPRWVKMVEIRPTNLKARKIVHHSIAYLVLARRPGCRQHRHRRNGPSGPSSREDLVNRRPQLMEWAIGKGYDMFREGTGKLIVPGEKISWDQHLHAVGEEVTAARRSALWFYPKGQEPKKRSYLIGFTGLRQREFLDIPPNSVAYTEGFTVLKENTMITNFQPHFHLRGKAMKVEAIKPDGGREIVSYVGNFNFNWMTNYIYDDDAAPIFPKGTIIQVSAWYDNTTANKDNPDPEQWVGYGDRTVDEMAHAWMNVVYLTDAEYKALLAERKAEGRCARPRPNASRPHRRARHVGTTMDHGGALCVIVVDGRAGVWVSAQQAPAAVRAAARVRRQHHRRLRGLVRQQGRQPQLPGRLLEPQPEAGAGRAHRPQQPHRAGRSRPGPAHALPAARAGRACSSSPCRRASRPIRSSRGR